MRETRLIFSKIGQSVFISHLDLMRTMQRSFLRAGLRIWHTEGFNPRPYMVFALPLPVGCESVCELVDFRVLDDIQGKELVNRLVPCCPAGIIPIEAYVPEHKFKEIKWLRLSGVLEFDHADIMETVRAVQHLLSRNELIVQRKTKRGEGDFDLIPHIKEVQVVPAGETIRISLIISAQEPSVNPALLTSAMMKYMDGIGPVFASYRREKLYDAEMLEFR